MEWSQEKVIELIDLYRENSILWNPTDPHYFKLKRKYAWEGKRPEDQSNIAKRKWNIFFLL